MTECCESSKKMMVRLGACKTGLSSSSVTYFTDPSVVVLILICFGAVHVFLYCLHLMYVFIFLVRFG